MGLFDSLRPKKDDEKDRPRVDFSKVQSGSSSTAPEGTVAPGDAAAGRSYTVKEGDTLSGIAQEAYGDASRWRAIYEANRDKIADPDLIHPGEVFVLPPNA